MSPVCVMMIGLVEFAVVEQLQSTLPAVKLHVILVVLLPALAIAISMKAKAVALHLRALLLLAMTKPDMAVGIAGNEEHLKVGVHPLPHVVTNMNHLVVASFEHSHLTMMMMVFFDE